MKKKQTTNKPIVKKVKNIIKKKQRPLTIKQRKFIDEVVKSWNATESANRVYKTKNKVVASSIWYENLRKPHIKAEIEDRLSVAKNMIYTIATTSEKDDTKLRACQDIIDRVEGKPTQRVIQDTTVKIVDKDTPIDELLAIIKK